MSDEGRGEHAKAPLVRVAGPADAAAVERVLHASYPALMASSYDQVTLEHALPLITRANPRLLSSGTFYIAQVAHEVVACGGWTLDEPGTGIVAAGVGHIRHFGVAADSSGHGIGRAIYNRCAEDAQKAGVSRFECFSSLNGVRFYASLGFVFVKRFNVELGGGVDFPSVHMTRMI